MSDMPSPMVLVVDDDDNILDMLSRTLRQAGFAVMTARHGRDALQGLKHSAVDIVVTDILMPEMDGIELMRRLHLERPELPVVAMSGLSDVTNLLRQSLKYGAKAVLYKPVCLADLVQRVRMIAASLPIVRQA